MKKLLNRAIYLLSLRDYSEYDLRRKLATQSSFNSKNEVYKDLDAIDNTASFIESKQKIDQAIQYCIDQGWINDLNYAIMFVKSRSQKGYGLQRILVELKQKGINSAIISQAINSNNIDWCLLAYQVASRKFSCEMTCDWKLKAKIFRYLSYRGFFQEEILSVFEKNDY